MCSCTDAKQVSRTLPSCMGGALMAKRCRDASIALILGVFSLLSEKLVRYLYERGPVGAPTLARELQVVATTGLVRQQG